MTRVLGTCMTCTAGELFNRGTMIGVTLAMTWASPESSISRRVLSSGTTRNSTVDSFGLVPQ